jgi:hypothetical protein
MLVAKLLEHFDPVTSLPIDVNEVRDRLVRMGVQDEITFYFPKMDASKIRAILHRYIKHAVPYGEPIFCSEVLIAEDQGDEKEEENNAWQRLAAVKELLHIPDCDKLTAASQEAVNNLFTAFSLPPEVREPAVENKDSVLNDRMRRFIALAILIPKAAREALRPLYPEKLTDSEIALMAGVPVRYISLVMDPSFEESLRIFLGFEAAHQPEKTGTSSAEKAR